MKESSMAQAISEEIRRLARREGQLLGAIAEAKKFLRLRGEEAFGAPDSQIIAAIEQLNDLSRLEELFMRVSRVGSWQKLLGQPTTGPRRRRRPPP